jgi:hypothetical protein
MTAERNGIKFLAKCGLWIWIVFTIILVGIILNNQNVIDPLNMALCEIVWVI